MPVEVQPGDEVFGATINAGGRLVVRAVSVGADTALAQIARLVTAAQSGKAPVQRLADRISGIFVPIVIVLALATLAFWLVAGETASFAFAAARRSDHRLPWRVGLRPLPHSCRYGPGCPARDPQQGAACARVDAQVDPIVLDTTAP